MDTKEEFSRALKELLRSRKTISIWAGKVTSVDESEGTCVVEDNEELEHFDVRLRATVDNSKKGVLLYPKVGSYVLVGDIGSSKSDYCVIQYSEIDKAYVELPECTVVSGQVKLNIDSSGVEISNGGTNLKSELDSLVNQLNSLITQIQAITVPCTGPGNPSGIPINAAAFQTISTQIGQVLK